MIPISCIDRRLTRFLLAFLALVDGAGLALTGVGLVWGPVLFVAGSSVILLGISVGYTKFRPDSRLAGLAGTSMHLLLYTALAGTLSYLLTTGSRPLIDSWLVATDRALGFDWPTLYAWGKTHVGWHIALIAVYFSLIPQLILVQIVLFTQRRFGRARELFWLFVLTSLACILLGAVFPAAGAFATFGVNLDNPYVRDFLALRAGTFDAVDLGKVQGIVQFPSFHVAMAMILTYAVRGMRRLFPCLLALNLGVFIATPLVGGHHVTDLLGGAVVTVVLVVVMRLCTRAGRADISYKS